MQTKHKVAVIGAGTAGSTIAYACTTSQLPAEIIVVDVDQRELEGQVLDISDAGFLTPTPVKAGTHKEAGQCDIIVIAAGDRQKPGEPRSELIGRNRNVLKGIIHDMQPIRQDAVLIVVSTPSDLLTYAAQQLSGLPRNQVIGTGTFLDTMRLRGSLSQKLQVQANAIHCYALGEHGDHQFIGWSSASLGGLPLHKYHGMEKIDTAAVTRDVKRKGSEILERKGATCFGIGSCVASLCDTILNDRRDIRPISCWDETRQCVLSQPAVLGMRGVYSILTPVLDENEHQQMEAAVKAIKQACRDLADEQAC
jgi:L-lactate dehydrogenase